VRETVIAGIVQFADDTREAVRVMSIQIRNISAHRSKKLEMGQDRAKSGRNQPRFVRDDCRAREEPAGGVDPCPLLPSPK